MLHNRINNSCLFSPTKLTLVCKLACLCDLLRLWTSTNSLGSRYSTYVVRELGDIDHRYVNIDRYTSIHIETLRSASNLSIGTDLRASLVLTSAGTPNSDGRFRTEPKRKIGRRILLGDFVLSLSCTHSSYVPDRGIRSETTHYIFIDSVFDSLTLQAAKFKHRLQETQSLKCKTVVPHGR